MCFCQEDGNALALLCPRLKVLALECSHLQSSTVSRVVTGLPLLNALKVGTKCLTQFYRLSEEDIATLRTLEYVVLQSPRDGLRDAARVGHAVIQVVVRQESPSDAIMQLTHCPRLWSLHIRVTVDQVKVVKDVVRLLPRLTELFLMFGDERTFEEVEKVANDALKIVRMRDHPLKLIEFSSELRFREAAWDSWTDEISRISASIASDGGEFAITDRCYNFITGMISLEDV